VDAGTQAHEQWPLARSDHWFDFLVTIDGARDFARRFAGTIETGSTDPGIGPMRLTV
jgi:hypothetical protein